MSNPTTTTPTGLFATAPAPVAATPAVNAPSALLNALTALAGAGYPGIFINGGIASEAKASFYLSVVDGVTVVAPSTRGSSSQLGLAAAALGMAAAQGERIAYNTSFAKASATKTAGVIPGVYGPVLLCGNAADVAALVVKIEADRAEAVGGRRVGGSALPSALPSAAPSAGGSDL